MNNYAYDESNSILYNIIESISLREHEKNPIHAWWNIDTLMQVVHQYPDHSLFLVTDCGNGVKQVTSTLLAKTVISILANCMEQMVRYYPVCRFNPYVDIFVRNAGNGDLINTIRRHEALQKQDGAYQNDEEFCIFTDMATGIDDFINHLRHEMRTPGFKTLLYNAQRVSKNNYSGLQEYIDALFDRYSRLLVLRVDFGYQMGNIIRTEQDIPLNYQEARNDFNRFLGNMDSNNLFQHVVGYAWKLEYGPDKGWHYHVMFFLDGSKAREDVTLAMLIGEYWQYNITQGRGLYHNCNAEKHKYSTPGIGMINYYDWHLRQGLNSAAEYLIKTDHVARAMAALNKGRTFGRKEMPEPRQNNIGRPRSLDPELFI